MSAPAVLAGPRPASGEAGASAPHPRERYLSRVRHALYFRHALVYEALACPVIVGRDGTTLRECAICRGYDLVVLFG
jgi:hypothetical protein